MFTLVVSWLVLPLLFSFLVVHSQALPSHPSLNRRILTTEGPAKFISPNAQTLVAQCEPLRVAFWNIGPPKNLTLWIAVNGVKTPGAFWSWPEPAANATWDATQVVTQDWDACDVAGGSVMWAELQGWEGDSTLLLGDGMSVQPSTVTSCLGGPGSESFEGDPSVVQLGQTLLATITTTISLDPSSTIVSSPSSSAATSPTSVPASRISTTARPKSSSRISARPGRPSASSPAPDLGANTSAPTAPKTGTHPAVIAASVIISVVGFAAIAGTYFLLRRMRRNIAKDADCRGGAEHGMAPGAVHGSGGGAGGGMTMLGSSSTASLPATVGVAGAGGHVSMADLPALNLVQPFTYSAPSTPVAGSATTSPSSDIPPSLPIRLHSSPSEPSPNSVAENPFLQELDAGHLAGVQSLDEDDGEGSGGGDTTPPGRTRIPPAYRTSALPAGSRPSPAAASRLLLPVPRESDAFSFDGASDYGKAT